MSNQYPGFTNSSPHRNINQPMGMMGYTQQAMMMSPPQQMQSQGLPGMMSPSHVPQQQQMQQQQLTLQTPTIEGADAPSMMNNTQNLAQTGSGQQPPAQKEFNTVSLCRFGQETVQDIVSRFQEVCGALRVIQPPNGTSSSSTEKKVQEQFRTIRLLFKRLRILYDKCNDGMEYMQYNSNVESLIPLKDEPDHKPEPAPTEEYKKALQENRESMEIVMMRNKQLREVIDRIRIIIWEINTMLSMRKS